MGTANLAGASFRILMAGQSAERAISALNGNDTAKGIQFISDVLSHLGQARQYVQSVAELEEPLSDLAGFYSGELDRVRQGIEPPTVARELADAQAALWSAAPLLPAAASF